MQRISFLPRVAFVVVQRVASLIANAHHGVLLSTTTTHASVRMLAMEPTTAWCATIMMKTNSQAIVDPCP